MAGPEGSRHAAIAAALMAGVARQQPGVALDYDQLANEVEAALDGQVAPHPLDPEGDGLETRELNSANDA